MFEYVIEYYDVDNCETAEDAGFVSAGTWAEATQKLSQCYGEKQIISLNITMTEDVYSFEDNDVEWDIEYIDD